ncbi:MAG: SPOR domain-containing protein [Gemmatimonadota bacterium]|nr:MAG: SPOR domain-containing protein [Gemmatimonadota bacterium]
MKTHTALWAILAVGITACRSDSTSNPVMEALAQGPPSNDIGAAVAFRFPSSGRAATLFRLPDLEEVSWRFDTEGRSTETILGFSSDNDLIFTLAEREDSLAFDLRALDLVTGRSRTLDSNVVAATVGPTGQAYVVRADGSIGQAEHRRTDTWPDTLTGVPTALWGAARGRLIAIIETDVGRDLAYIARGQPIVRQPLPTGTPEVSKWGRLVAVTVDSGVALFDPADPSAVAFAALRPAPLAIAISPSGHRIYAALADGRLVAVDRFAANTVQQSQLPGPAVALRTDSFGRLMLAQSENGTIWAIDVIGLAVLATINGSWDRDLPTVAPDFTILVRQGSGVVAYQGEEFSEAAVVQEQTGDLWLTTAWDPRRPALEFAVDSAPTTEPASVEIYVQVSSSGNPAWAEDLASELQAAGLNAKVLRPDDDEERYRVVLGPFASREEAEASGRRLGRAFWIFTREPEVPPEPETSIP